MSNGNLYSFGQNSCGQAGLPLRKRLGISDVYLEPVKVNFPEGETIKNIIPCAFGCGVGFIIVECNSSKYYASGLSRNESGEFTPLDQFPKNETIKKMVGIFNRFYLYCDSGNLYTFQGRDGLKFELEKCENIYDSVNDKGIENNNQMIMKK